MTTIRPRKKTALPKLASRLIKYYLLALLTLGIVLWLAVLAEVSIGPDLVAIVWDIFCRAGVLLMLFLGVVSVEQSVR
jgi:hypothetical protein